MKWNGDRNNSKLLILQEICHKVFERADENLTSIKEELQNMKEDLTNITEQKNKFFRYQKVI